MDISILTGELPKQKPNNCFFGRPYDDSDILEALGRAPGTVRYNRILRQHYSYTKETNIPRTAAQLIADGNIIGWFQGDSELGPRALGHRSLIADPRSVSIRDTLNNQIKHREWFRPFAPSIMKNSIRLFFDYADMTPFMLEAPKVKEEMRSRITAAIHVDGTARLQIVDKEQDPLFFSLIKEFSSLTGLSTVLNTSFNDREPIVESPGDALTTFLTTDLAYLIMNDYIICKSNG